MVTFHQQARETASWIASAKHMKAAEGTVRGRFLDEPPPAAAA